MTTLSQLKTFIAVVDQGGFTAASRRLGLSQPAVSRTVATLEKELGLPLFMRRRDGLALTEAGAVALTHAREAVRQLTLMRTEVAGLAGDITGTLSLASLPTATATLIAPQLRTFARRHPAVTIRLLEGSKEEILDWLDQGAAEAGVVSLPSKGLDAAVLGVQEMVAVVPANSRLAAKDIVTYADLAREPFVRGTGGCADVFMPIARRQGIEFDLAFEAREIGATLEIVRAGLGVSILPSAGLPELPGVVVRPLLPLTERRLGIAVSASASAPARAFLDQIAALDLD
ncbi:LysR family transcriptional regulator [Mycobacterium intracellulare]|jgi:DNA-binding transcriptional LysR family regulator|uniref:Probable hydrogen peroxide-inducible genes activator n=2 Tax=Mycobacterium intracellulare TaxID=1767 RepID=A0A7R7RNM9_MYCIT|nr:LysR family transcriptional regulator [Mycobacterium intracellulare]AFC43220.1 transcriptional regulator, LysR family protein [Mycobacterium intracellulare ATCC 13950]ASW85190.1 LysR family transcriptional regulator [Mycobacterium intracellulare]PBA32923.1 LysR family transcriptional regulator [Mycobacterium intracellulare]UGU03239.1 LysR family transcriptional regulator [Mycobacterium intracellulare]BCO46353.1 LysR family transcriptional regulator [Mycobacterium intracellulare]